MAAEIKLKGLPRKLVIDGLLEEEAAINALKASLKEKVSFTNYLVGNNILTAKKIAMEASKEFGLPVFDLDAIDQDSIPRDVVDDKLIKNTTPSLSIKEGNVYILAFLTPPTLPPSMTLSFKLVSIQKPFW